jgi:hypothetical protein
MIKVKYVRGLQAAEKAAREGYAKGLDEDLLTDDELESLRVCANESAELLAFSRGKVAPAPVTKRTRKVAYVYREPVEPIPYVPPVYEPIEEPER